MSFGLLTTNPKRHHDSPGRICFSNWVDLRYRWRRNRGLLGIDPGSTRIDFLVAIELDYYQLYTKEPFVLSQAQGES